MEKKIKSAEELIEELDSLNRDDSGNTIFYKWQVLRLMKAYARIKIEAQLEIVLEEAETKDVSRNPYESYYVIDEDSIRNCTRVTLE